MNRFNVKENSYGHKKRFDFVSKQINDFCLKNNLNQKEINILDVGCGSGLLMTLPLGELGYNILGIDLDTTSIEFAKGQNLFKSVCFEVNAIENITEKYDIILACEILEHLEDPVKFLNTLKLQLKTTGIIILTTPNGYGWSEMEAGVISTLYQNRLLRMAFNRLKGHKQDITMNKDDKHLQRFSYGSLQEIFKKSSLAVATMQNGPIFGGPITERTLAKIPGFKNISNCLGNIVPGKMALV
jgi:ubiquinone biosynthesis O-methyltransferase